MKIIMTHYHQIIIQLVQIQFIQNNYRLMNKENMPRNISVLMYNKEYVPIKETPQLSFRNLNTKSFIKTNDSRDDVRVSPVSTKRNRNKISKFDLSEIGSEADSLAVKQQNHLLQALKLQRESLTNTLKMYRQQMDMLQHENAKLKKQGHRWRHQVKQCQQKLQQNQRKDSQLVKKVKEYDSMLPKLVQIEELQERVIEENAELKNKIKMQQALLINIGNLAKNDDGRSLAMDKIKALTQPFLLTLQTNKSVRRL